MNYLYYGNGQCTVEGLQIRGIEIRYSGNVRIESTAGENFFAFNLNQAILIIPAGGKSGYLTDLFKYSGDLKINSIIVANDDGSGTADITVAYHSQAGGSGTGYKLAHTIAVAADSTLVVIDKATSIYLEEDRSIVVTASSGGDLDVICSYETIID